MALDLSMLDEPQGQLENSAGTVLELRLDEVEEDPEQPRKTFSQVSLEMMAGRIREKGHVEVPVTVRPKRGGKYRLVDGARRYRASCIAGVSTIRAIVEADHAIDSYTQVVVNIQRAELPAMELAQFIERRRAAGDSLGRIAQALGMSADAVTAHRALLDAPPPILEAFRADHLRSVRGAYHLCRLYARDADAVKAFMAEHTGDEITRSMISRFEETLRRDDGAQASNDAVSVAAGPLSDGEDLNLSRGSQPSSGAERLEAHVPGPGSAPTVHELPFHNPDIERGTKPPKLDDPTHIRKPLLLANYAGSAVMVRLDRRPTAPGLAFIKYEDGRGELEVELGVLSNWTLTDSKVSP
jgi:ParB family transcriptional regulator, chromosome partitioning protein